MVVGIYCYVYVDFLVMLCYWVGENVVDVECCEYDCKEGKVYDDFWEDVDVVYY